MEQGTEKPCSLLQLAHHGNDHPANLARKAFSRLSQLFGPKAKSLCDDELGLDFKG